MEKTLYTIDAEGKALGRVATQAASFIMGKNKPDFVRNIAPKVMVTVKNASALNIPESKLKNKKYFRHSQYPGGQTVETMAKVIEKKGYKEIVKEAVYGMLPKNKLRAIMIKNLTVIE